MTETRIYVGLNDPISNDQKFETEKYVGILEKVCANYGVAFSFSMSRGGYFYESGDFTLENSLILTLIDADKSKVNEIAKDLCAFFRKESVMVTENVVNAYYVNESLE